MFSNENVLRRFTGPGAGPVPLGSHSRHTVCIVKRHGRLPICLNYGVLMGLLVLRSLCRRRVSPGANILLQRCRRSRSLSGQDGFFGGYRPTGAGQWRQRKVLIVDDEPTICNAVADCFEEWPGTQVTVARHGRAGVERLETTRFEPCTHRTRASKT